MYISTMIRICIVPYDASPQCNNDCFPHSADTVHPCSPGGDTFLDTVQVAIPFFIHATNDVGIRPVLFSNQHTVLFKLRFMIICQSIVVAALFGNDSLVCKCRNRLANK